jgi:hypothetical protein
MMAERAPLASSWPSQAAVLPPGEVTAARSSSALWPAVRAAGPGRYPRPSVLGALGAFEHVKILDSVNIAANDDDIERYSATTPVGCNVQRKPLAPRYAAVVSPRVASPARGVVGKFERASSA